MNAFKIGPLFYWIILVSACPMIVSSLATIVGVEANDNRIESVIYFSFSIFAYLLIFGLKGVNKYLIATIIALSAYTTYSIVRGNNISWAIIDAALIFQFAIHLATANHILSSISIEQAKQQFFSSSLILLFLSTVFILLIGAKNASVDHLSPSLIASAAPVNIIIPSAMILLLMSFYIYSVFGIFKISIAIQFIVFAYASLGGLKFSKNITKFIAITFFISFIFFLSTLSIDSLESYANLFTNRVSSEIRFNELRFLLNRDSYLNIFGGGFGYASSFREFINYEEFSDQGRLRVFHFAFTWLFAKFGYSGVLLLLVYSLFIVYNCAKLRIGKSNSIFIICMALVSLASLHLTFGWTMKNYLLPLSLALIQRYSR